MDNKPVTAEKARRRLNSDTVYYIVNTAILVLLTLIVVYPLYFLVIASISDPDLVLNGEVLFYPREITFSGFERLFQDNKIWNGYLNTIINTVASTAHQPSHHGGGGLRAEPSQYDIQKVFSLAVHHHHVFRRRTDPVLSGRFAVGLDQYPLGAHRAFGAERMERVHDEGVLRIEYSRFHIRSGANRRRQRLYDFCAHRFALRRRSSPSCCSSTRWGNWNSYFNALIFITTKQELFPLQMVLREILIVENSARSAAAAAIRSSNRSNLRIRSNIRRSSSLRSPYSACIRSCRNIFRRAS